MVINPHHLHFSTGRVLGQRSCTSARRSCRYWTNNRRLAIPEFSKIGVLRFRSITSQRVFIVRLSKFSITSRSSSDARSCGRCRCRLGFVCDQGICRANRALAARSCQSAHCTSPASATYRLLGLQRKSLTARAGLALGESQAFPATRHSCRVSYRAGKVTSVGEPHP